MQSPTKVDFRLTRKTTTLGGVHIPADPHVLRLDRRNVREHIAFGRGIHTCAGTPLARVEGDITISEAKHAAPRNVDTATNRPSCCVG